MIQKKRDKIVYLWTKQKTQTKRRCDSMFLIFGFCIPILYFRYFPKRKKLGEMFIFIREKNHLVSVNLISPTPLVYTITNEKLQVLLVT